MDKNGLRGERFALLPRLVFDKVQEASVHLPIAFWAVFRPMMQSRRRSSRITDRDSGDLRSALMWFGVTL